MHADANPCVAVPPVSRPVNPSTHGALLPLAGSHVDDGEDVGGRRLSDRTRFISAGDHSGSQLREEQGSR